MSALGPRRLVLIRSGKYDYAEVELTDPVHLVGANNVGKTSLIATLQLLFIDSPRQMHFSRDWSETRKYYFPDRNSYVLFECLTPTGLRVFGVRGRGPVRQYEIERLSYVGRFERQDFLDEDDRVREPDEIPLRFADRGFSLLSPRELRAALTGSGDSKSVRLDLVPLRRRGHYERFCGMFRSLLRLAHLRQQELKDLFLEVYRSDFRQSEIDLEREFAEKVETVRRETRKLQDLRAIETDAREVLDAARERATCREKLPALWEATEGALRREVGEHEKRLEQAERTLGVKRERLREIQEERKELRETEVDAQRRRGAVEGKLQDLERDQDKYRWFSVEQKRATRDRLQEEVDELGARLKDLDAGPVERIEARIRSHEKELGDTKDRLESLQHLLGTHLASQLSSDDVARLARFFNPALLGIDLRRDGNQISDEDRLRARLRGVLAQLEGDKYADEAVQLALPAPIEDVVARYTESDEMAAHISDLESALVRDRRQLDTGRRADEIWKSLEERKQEVRTCAQEIARFEEFEERLSHAEEWQSARDDLAGTCDRLTEQLAALDEEEQECRSHSQDATKMATSAQDELKRLRDIGDSLRAPDPRWPPKEQPWVAGIRDIDTLVDEYRKIERAERDYSDTVRRGFARIQAHVYDRYDDDSEEESLRRLEEDLEAIEERARALESMWKGVASALASSFKALLGDYEQLESHVSKLNRGLAKVSVSNLRRLQLRMEPHAEWLARLRRVADQQDLPLFSDPDEFERTLSDLGRMLQAHRRVTLAELFNFRFEIETPDGRSRSYDNLSAIESNGTTITIKVLIHLRLIRDLLTQQSIRLPFYLDEAASLDPENLRGILDTANALGFVPVLASPEPMEGATNLYFLTEENNRVVLDPASSLVRVSRAEEARDAG